MVLYKVLEYCWPIVSTLLTSLPLFLSLYSLRVLCCIGSCTGILLHQSQCTWHFIFLDQDSPKYSFASFLSFKYLFKCHRLNKGFPNPLLTIIWPVSSTFCLTSTLFFFIEEIYSVIYFISCLCAPTRMEPPWGRDLWDFHCYVLRAQKSSWCLVGLQYLFTYL